MNPLTVKEVMSGNVIKISENASVSDMIFLFNREKITGAPVVNDKERLVGVVSLNDVAASTHQRAAIASRKLESEFYQSWGHYVTPEDVGGFYLELNEDWKVKDIMSRSVLTVTEDTSLREAAAMMLYNKIHRLIVVNGSRIAGVISTSDILRLIVEGGIL
jgi:CBS domain-containing protein